MSDSERSNAGGRLRVVRRKTPSDERVTATRGRPAVSTASAEAAALEDDARNPRYLETVARKGYRVIGEVSDAGDSESPQRKPAVWTIAVLLILAGIGGNLGYPYAPGFEVEVMCDGS